MPCVCLLNNLNPPSHVEGTSSLFKVSKGRRWATERFGLDWRIAMPEQKNFKSSFLCPILCPLPCMKKLTRPVIESKQRLAEKTWPEVWPATCNPGRRMLCTCSPTKWARRPSSTAPTEPSSSSSSSQPLPASGCSSSPGPRDSGARRLEIVKLAIGKISIQNLPPAQFQVQWSRAPNLTLGPGPSTQALNCAQSKWQVTFSTWNNNFLSLANGCHSEARYIKERRLSESSP